MIRIGLVGFGLAGRVFHAPLIASVEGLELTVVVERSSNEAAARYSAIRTLRSLDELLEDASIDLVVLATPSGSHFSLAKQIIAAGKHLVVDKPLTATAAETAELIALAQQAGVQLIPFHNRRWDGDFLTVKDILAHNALGRLVNFSSHFDRWRPQQKPNAWREHNQPGSGILLDLGTHLIDQALQLFGKPQSVSAEVTREREPLAGADDSFTVRLHYPGLVATLSANCLAEPPRPRFHLRGTKANFWKHGLDPQEAALKDITHITNSNWGKEDSSHWGTLFADSDGALIRRPIETLPGDYRSFYRAVRETIEHGTPHPVQPADALLVARVIEAALESSQTGNSISYV